MTKTLKWRLGKLPTPEEVSKLVSDKIITNEEARQILFSEQEENERDNESLKEEIKFLRNLVDKLSQNDHTKIVEVIKQESIKPYSPWFTPYYTWSTSNFTDYDTSNITLTGFSDIQTF